ncbi:hypothetical protein D3C86_1995450 [compost metagenome]
MNDLIHLWIDSLKEKGQTDRKQQDLAIAQKLHPQMYGNVGEEPKDLDPMSQI